MATRKKRPSRRSAKQAAPFDFDAWVAESRDRLQAKIEATKTAFGLGSYDSFNVDQPHATIAFSSNGQVRVTASVRIVGSIGSGSGTWMWSWANDSIVPAARQGLDELRAFGERHSISALSAPTFIADEGDGWSMTAVAADLLEAQGAYRVPTANGATFLLLDRLERVG